MHALAKLGKSKLQVGRIAPAMLLSALLTACAAPPPSAPVVAAPAPTPAPAPAVVAGVPDFTQITQTSCPGSAASYDEWVARFGFDAIGGLIAGVLAASFGASRTLMLEGGLLLLFMLFLQARKARLRERIVQAGPPLPVEST